MSDNLFLHKYNKYKTKYFNLKRKMKDDQQHNFYFVHSTTSFENLLNILKSGTIYPGKDLEPSQRKFCGSEAASKFIFTNIYFEDLQNLSHTRDYSLLLHPKIMYKNGFFFNRGWIAGTCNESIYVDGKNAVINNEQITQIKKFLENPTNIPELMKTNLWNHEILFNTPIDLNDGNLIGIVCNYGDATDWTIWRKTIKKLPLPTDKPLKLIQKAIRNKSYSNVKIMVRNAPLYTLEELTEYNS